MAKTNNHRRFPGESSRCRPDGAKMRREEAVERQAKYDQLTVAQKIEQLDLKFGVGKGAQKQRKKLQQNGKKIVESQPTTEQALPEEVLAEIEAMNESVGKKKLKAKDRRSQKPNNSN